MIRHTVSYSNHPYCSNSNKIRRRIHMASILSTPYIINSTKKNSQHYKNKKYTRAYSKPTIKAPLSCTAGIFAEQTHAKNKFNICNHWSSNLWATAQKILYPVSNLKTSSRLYVKIQLRPNMANSLIFKVRYHDNIIYHNHSLTLKRKKPSII